MCDECAKLDLEDSFARAFSLYEGARRGRNTRELKVYCSDNGPPYLAQFHYVTSLAERLSCTRHCKLCTFLSRTIPDPNTGTFKLLAICSSESYLFKPPKQDKRGRPERRPWDELEHNVFLAVVPEVPLIPKTGIPLRWFETELPMNGSIYRLTQRHLNQFRLARPRDLLPKAELDLVRTWLNLCRDMHPCCRPKKPAGASLSGFRAINCTKTPPVVEELPWSQSYVALSYVWGPPCGDWPQTILDAVEVTKRLGEQYLWVDRLCINQSNLQEKQFLISKMDAIYEGAEFTIIAAAGDARTGLPGVLATPRVQQPWVKLEKRSRTEACKRADHLLARTPLHHFETLGISKEEYLFGFSREEWEETCKDDEWLDLNRRGLKTKIQIDVEFINEFKKDRAIMEKYNISEEHLRVFKNFAEDYRRSIDEWMIEMEHLAQRKGIPLQDLAPHMLREIATSAGMPENMIEAIASLTIEPPAPPITSSSKVERGLDSGLLRGQTILVSTLEDPRTTIKQSEWATRGWTYQEGVLSNRRLVFTPQQTYWECHGMATNESLDLPLQHLHDQSGTRMSPYMLSGVFDGDLHRVPTLQYGFQAPTKDEVSEQVRELDSHVHAFTTRTLSYASDSLNAFLGIASHYSTNDGLCLVLGLPVWAGLFANGEPGLQHTFALSLSAWAHTAPPETLDADYYGADVYNAECPRRTQFPSWTWVGWQGQVGFSAVASTKSVDLQGDDSLTDDTMHVDFFRAMTDKSWVDGIARHLWSAEMRLHAADGSSATLLTGRASVAVITANPAKTWLLTIREPRVLPPYAFDGGQWRNRRLQLHLSVPLTEAELAAGHQSGELVTVLVFVSTVPFVFNGTARYLILRRTTVEGMRWVRIGRLAVAVKEESLEQCTGSEDLVNLIPGQKFGRYITMV